MEEELDLDEDLDESEEIETNNLVVIKLINDSDIVGEMVELTNSFVRLLNPFEICQADTPNGVLTYLRKYNQYSSEDTLPFQLRNIIYVTNPTNSIDSLYKVILSKLGVKGFVTKESIDALADMPANTIIN